MPTNAASQKLACPRNTTEKTSAADTDATAARARRYSRSCRRVNGAANSRSTSAGVNATARSPAVVTTFETNIASSSRGRIVAVFSGSVRRPWYALTSDGPIHSRMTTTPSARKIAPRVVRAPRTDRRTRARSCSQISSASARLLMALLPLPF
jgi:hypothetical protein